MIETEGLTHVHLTVNDLEASLHFYQGVFGMQEMFRDGPDMVFLRTPGARDSITLNADPAPNVPPGEPGGIAHIGFRLKDAAHLDDAIAQVERHGGRLVERGAHDGKYPYAYVADPDGYVIEL